MDLIQSADVPGPDCPNCAPYKATVVFDSGATQQTGWLCLNKCEAKPVEGLSSFGKELTDRYRALLEERLGLIWQRDELVQLLTRYKMMDEAEKRIDNSLYKETCTILSRVKKGQT